MGDELGSDGVFLVSAALILLTAFVVVIGFRVSGRAEVSRDLAWEISQERGMAAQTALRNLTLSAATARELRRAA